MKITLKKISRIVISIFLFVVFILSFHLYQNQVYINNSTNNTSVQTVKNLVLSSGSASGNYYKTANYIADIVNSSPQEDVKRTMQITAITSNGSVDNISRLRSHFADLIIVQKDVLMQNFYSEKNPLKNIFILSPLFEEKFLLYAHGQQISFNELIKLANTRTIKVGVTSKTGTSYKTFKNVSELLSLPINKVEFVSSNYENLTEDFKSKKIDFILTFSLPLEDLSNNEDISTVYFDKNQVDLLTAKMPYLSVASTEQKDRYTLSVLSLLVGLDDKDKLPYYNSVVEAIVKNTQQNDNAFIASQIEDTIKRFKQQKGLYVQNFSSFAVSSAFTQNIGINNTMLYAKYSFIIATIFIIAFITLSKKGIDIKYTHSRYKYIIWGVFMVIVAFLVSTQMILYFEQQLFLETGVRSSIINMRQIDLYTWNIIRIFGGNDAGIFPMSTIAKIFTSLSAYVFWVGTISIAVLEYLMYSLSKKRKQGLMQIKEKNHIVIIDWHDATPALLTTLLDAYKEYHLKKDIKVVCITENVKNIIDNNIIIEELEKKKIVTFVEGDARTQRVLEQSNIHHASKIVLLSSDSTISSDEKILLRLLTIVKFCKTKKMQFGNEIDIPYIIAQVNTKEFVQDIKNAGANGIIHKNEMIDGILVQSVLNPGISKLMNNLLTFSDNTNEFYTVDLLKKENAHFRNKTFDELLMPLRKQGILLIALRIVYLNNEGVEISDEEEINILLKKDDLTRQIITNPITEAEKHRKTDENDQLIVLAATGKELNAGIKNLKDYWK